MNSKKPLFHERIVLTGTAITKKIEQYIQELGGTVEHYPLIKTAEIQQPDDALLLKRSQQVDWMIFTSQNAVSAFIAKVLRHDEKAANWHGRIAVVGDKTEKALIQAGFRVAFKPSVFSAEHMVQELASVIHDTDRCMFIRGSLAKETLVDGLRCQVEKWTIYATVESTDYTVAMCESLKKNANCTIVFASPSAVQVYERTILPVISWQDVQVAAIGHVTEAALVKAGAQQIITPTVYTMQAVIDEIVTRKER